ncbi:hypothetical protein T10_3745 [Trichinella papuae]|uniref:Uncharacterized protein n=1 Tax=Trichinella papuae TaxID=268474 RepID=A0A0V1MXI0_9BILA|nr:hypothetical protein T10_3745 [Trichinella papuae]
MIRQREEQAILQSRAYLHKIETEKLNNGASKSVIRKQNNRGSLLSDTNDLLWWKNFNFTYVWPFWVESHAYLLESHEFAQTTPMCECSLSQL